MAPTHVNNIKLNNYKMKIDGRKYLWLQKPMNNVKFIKQYSFLI